MDTNASLLSGHMAIAGAIGGAAALGESLAGPLFAPFVGIGSAAITASLAVHAVHRVARQTQQPTHRVLGKVARHAGRAHENVLAAQALDFACRVGARDRRAAFVGASVVGRYAIAQVRGVVGHLLTAWCPPLQGAGAALGASRAAIRGASFMKTVEDAAAEAVATHDEIPASTERPITRPQTGGRTRLEAAA